MAFKAFLVLAFFIIGRPQDLIPALQPYRVVVVLTLLTASIVFLQRGVGWFSSILRFRALKTYGVFFMVMALGIPFAYHRKVAFDSVLVSYLSNMIFFCLLLLLVDSRERLRKLFVVILISAFSYSVFGLALGRVEDGRFFTYGAMFDPNDIAYVLISLFPMTLFFIFRKSGGVARAAALLTAAASIGLILLTGSRAGLLGLGLIFLVVIFSKRTIVKTSHKAVLISAMLLTAVFYSDRINVERYQTLADISGDYNVTDEFGRVQIWQRGLELFYSNPITGVGANCFPMAIGGYREDIGLTPKWQATHNSYIQVLVETGAIGFSVFLALIFGAFRTLSRLRRSTGTTAADDEVRAMARSVELGFVGHVFTAFFLTQGYSVLFTLFFAIPAAMEGVTEAQRVSAVPAVERKAGLAAR